MKPHAIGVLLLLFTTGLYSNPYNKGCDSYHCSQYDWDHGLKKFDPHSIQWPLHHTGEIYKDKIDGGHHNIHIVYYDHYYKKHIAPLKDFRKMPYCPDPYYLKEGIPMEYYFECEEDYTQKPHWKDADCSLIGKSHQDKEFYIDGPSCSKIVRDWVLVDWCKYEPNTGADYNEDDIILVYDMTEYKAYFTFDTRYGSLQHDGYYKFKQVIKILDVTKPELKDCEEVTYDLKGKCTEYVKVKNTIWDKGPCPGYEMHVDLEVVDAHGYLVHKEWLKVGHGEEFWINAGHLYPGWYTLHWNYKDGCQNKNYCTQKLKVIDTAGPSLLCIHNLSSSISDEHGMTIWAKDFVIKATDPCGYDDAISISFAPDADVPSMTFDCRGDFGFHDLKVYATSHSGAQTFCNVELFIADHFACSDQMQIAGLLYNRDEEPLTEVEVDVMQSGSLVASSMSNSAGQYLIDGIPMDKSVEYIEPHIYENPKDGLDAEDLVLLLRHITGADRFDEVLEYAAADVNSDGKIDMNDFWTLASLMYDLTHRSVNIKPWKFVDSKLYRAGIVKAATLTAPIAIRSFRHRYDIIGLKTGDIDFSWSASPKSKNRSAITFSATQKEGVTILSNESENRLHMIEIHMSGVPADLQVSPNPELWKDSELIRQHDGQNLHIILTSAEALQIDAGDIVVQINEEVELNDVSVSVVLNESQELVSKEVSLKTVLNGSLTSYSPTMKVVPNPMTDRFTIAVDIASREPVSLRLYSITGQLIRERHFQNVDGIKESSFDWGTEMTPGLYIMEVKGEFGSLSQKIVKQH